MQVGNISVKLGLVTLEFDKKVEGAKKQAKELQAALDTLGGGIKTLNGYWKQLGGSLSVGSIGFAALLQQTIAFTDEISDLAKGFDITIGQTLAFRSALQGAGVDAAGASKMMSTLFGKISDGQKGNDVVVAQFEKLGISFQELQKMTPYEAINRVAQGFSNVSNSFEKVKLIKEFFGKAGIGVDIQQISDALAQGTGSFDKYAESIKRVGVIEDNMKRSLDNLKIAFADMIAPFTRDGIVSIEKFQATLASIAAVSVVSGLIAIAPALKAITMAMWGLIAGTEAFNVAAGNTTPMGILLKAGALLAGVGAYLYTMNSLENAKTSPEANMRAYVPRDRYQGETGEPVKNLTKEQEVMQEQVNLQSILLGFEKEKSKLQVQAIASDTISNQLALNELNTQEKIAQIEFKRNQDMAKAKENTPEYRAMIEKEAGLKIAVAKTQLATMQKIAVMQAQAKSDLAGMMANGFGANIDAADLEGGPKAIRENDEATRKRALSFTRSAEDQQRMADIANQRLALENQYAALLPIERDLLLEQFDLQTRIAEKEREGRAAGLNEKQIADISDIMRQTGQETMKLKRQSYDAQRTFEFGWSQAFNSFADNSTNMAKVAGDSFNSIVSNMDSALDSFVKTGKLNFKNFARSIIQDLIAIQLKASANSIFKMMFGPSIGGINTSGADLAMFYADGGDPPVNKPAIVGERGPELFIPKTAGTVIPNHALSNMGSTTNVTNNYINAIDTASFEQRLLASPNAIWAANTYANKTLATSRGRA
jgi:lambda family phage tail tape measure protein